MGTKNKNKKQKTKTRWNNKITGDENMYNVNGAVARSSWMSKGGLFQTDMSIGGLAVPDCGTGEGTGPFSERLSLCSQQRRVKLSEDEQS